MQKKDYSVFSNSELRSYILKNRHDLDAMEAFFDRRSPDSEATWYVVPKNPSIWREPYSQIPHQKNHGLV